MIAFLISLLIFILVGGLIAYVCAWAIGKIPVVNEIGPAIVWGIFGILVLFFVAEHIQLFGRI